MASGQELAMPERPEFPLWYFRMIADAMAGDEPRDWEWSSEDGWRNHFRITEASARERVANYGGIARRMNPEEVAT